MTTPSHPPVRGGTRALLIAVLTPALVATLAGLVLLWPSGNDVRLGDDGRTVDGTITALRRLPCAGTAPEAGIRCTVPEVRLTTGRHVTLSEQSDDRLAIGDDVVVAPAPDDSSAYEVVARQRGPALPLLGVGVMVLLVLVARSRGLRLLAALAIAVGVTTVFAVPAILDGHGAMAVAVVAAAVIATALVVVGHGIDTRSAIALVAVLVAVVAAAVVGRAVADAASLAGLARDTPSYLDVGRGELPLRGLLLAGLVIGTVGALVDVAVRQVDAAWDVQEVDPDARWRALTTAAARAGRAHLADAGATLVIAMTGAALPILVLLTASDTSVVDALRGETVAVELVRAAIGIGALAFVAPVTAALAAFVVVREACPRDAADPRRFRSRRERELWDGT